jgi:hypothetical protein
MDGVATLAIVASAWAMNGPMSRTISMPYKRVPRRRCEAAVANLTRHHRRA